MAFIRKLPEPHIPIPEDFLSEARERVERGENPRFYDITFRALPLLYNLQGYSTSDGQSVSTERIILFEEDVNFRGCWGGANRLFLNAVILGPSAP